MGIESKEDILKEINRLNVLLQKPLYAFKWTTKSKIKHLELELLRYESPFKFYIKTFINYVHFKYYEIKYGKE